MIDAAKVVERMGFPEAAYGAEAKIVSSGVAASGCRSRA
jgi:hypothetical protein